MDQVKIGNFIASLRKEKGLTQAGLGDLVGVTGKAVSRWETGLGVPDISIVNRVSEVLGVSTTELLNGERVVDLDKQNLDEITENSISFYRKKLKQDFKRVSIILLSIIFALISILSLIFVVNNFNKCKVYSIESAFLETKFSGILSVTNKKNTLVISNFKYTGTNIEYINAIQYEITAGDETIYTEGDISTYEKSSDEPISIVDYFNTLTIYLNDINNSKLDSLINNNVNIRFKYIGYGGRTYIYNIPIKLTKEFSNSKILYFK